MGRQPDIPSDRADGSCSSSPHCRSFVRRLDVGADLPTRRALWLHIGPFGAGTAGGVYHGFTDAGVATAPRPLLLQTGHRFDPFVGYSLDVLGFPEHPDGVPATREVFTLDGVQRTLWVVRKVAWEHADGPYVRLDVGCKISEHRVPDSPAVDKSVLYHCTALVHNGRFPPGHPPLLREPEGLVRARQAVALYYGKEVACWEDAAARAGIVERHLRRLRKEHGMGREYFKLPRDLEGRVLAQALAHWIEHGTATCRLTKQPTAPAPEPWFAESIRTFVGSKRVFIAHARTRDRDVLDQTKCRRSS